MHELDESCQALCKSFVEHPISAVQSSCQKLHLLTPLDDPELMAGAPIALQLVGPRLGDEQLLKDVETIDAVLNG